MNFNPGIAEFQSTEYFQCLALRDEVLRRPLGLSFNTDDLAAENKDIHFFVKSGDLVIATSMLSKASDKIAKMRQVATMEKYQNQGVGSLLLNFFEDYCLQNQFNKIELHARKEAVNFYLKNKYTIVGEIFMEVGIEHNKMVKDLF